MILLFRRLCVDPDCPLPWLTAIDDPNLSASLALMLDHPERAHTVDSLAARVFEQEKLALPEAIRRVLSGETGLR